MATNTKLLQAKNLAKNYYEARKTETTARAQPPESQNVNRNRQISIFFSFDPIRKSFPENAPEMLW